MVKDSYANRMKKALTLRGITQSQLCEKTGIPKSAISQYIGGAFEPKQDRVHLIAKKLDLSEAWLMGYDVPMERAVETTPKPFDVFSIPNIHQVQLKRFPLLGNIACGEPIWADEDKENYIMANCDIKADFCLVAKGDSMINARILDGDVVFIKEQPLVNDGEIAAVIIDNEATLKRVYYNKEESELTLVAENPLFKSLRYTGEELNQIRILGKAIYFMSRVN